MRANVIILTTSIWAVTACSAMEQSKQADNSNGNEKVTPGDDHQAPDAQDTSAVAFGLADTCTFTKGVDGHSCFTCEPRELPVTACIPGDVPADFDPAVACTHEDKTMTCDIGSTESFVFNFKAMTKDEKLFARLPTLLAGASLFLGQGLKNKPEQLATVMAALEILAKYKKNLFTGVGADVAFDEAAKLAKAKKPDLTDKELAAFKVKFQTAMTQWQAKKQLGAGDGDVLSMAQSLLSALPAGLASKLPQFDIASITAMLSGDDGLDLNAIMKILPGGGLESILASLKGGDKPVQPAQDGATAGEEEAAE